MNKIDITAEHCPMTFVKVKLALAKMGVGEKLEVTLKGEEPLKNVPKSAIEVGHKILENRQLEDGEHLLIIEK